MAVTPAGDGALAVVAPFQALATPEVDQVAVIDVPRRRLTGLCSVSDPPFGAAISSTGSGIVVASLEAGTAILL